MLGEKNNATVAFLTDGGCLISANESDYSSDEACKKTISGLNAILPDNRIKHVVLGQYWGFYSKKDPKLFERALHTMQKWPFDEINQRKLFVLMDYRCEPGFFDLKKFNINRLFPQPIPRSSFIVEYPKSNTWETANQKVKNALENMATIIETEHFVCKEGKCDLLEAYCDDDHLKSSFIFEHGSWIDCVFDFK